MSLRELRPVMPILIGASVMLSLGMGIRQSFGLVMPPLTKDIAVTVSDFALAMSLLILKAGYDVSRRAFEELLDIKLSPQEESQITRCIDQHRHRIASFHALRTRKAGTQRFVDLHLVLPPSCNISEAHQICDNIEESIRQRLKNSSITIHCEPCNRECEQCSVSCPQDK